MNRLTRRQVLQEAALWSTGFAVGCQGNASRPPQSRSLPTTHSNSPEQMAMEANQAWFMPDEGDPHSRTWMAFGASKRIWGRELLPIVQQNLATIANTIARYEPVSMLVRDREQAIARDLLEANVELVVTDMDDLWIRDTGPVFLVNDSGEKAAANLNFNGWGEKQTFRKDQRVADFVAQQAGVASLSTDLVLEGGCIEVDGHGTAIITESCVLNDNRNPGVSKAEFEAQLMPLLGLDKIIWLPGIRGQDITDGHTDFYARFAGPGQVIVGYEPDPDLADHELTKQHIEILKTATDAQGNDLDIIILEAPSQVRPAYAQDDDFAAGYIGFYLCNGAVIMQEFGDEKADQAAQASLRNAFPDREVVAINIDGIAAGGGSIHCATQQEPNV